MHLLARCVKYCCFTWHHFSLWKVSWKCRTFGQQGILNLVSLVNSLEHLWTIQFHRRWQTQGLPCLKQGIVGEGRGSLHGATWEITDLQPEKVFQPVYHHAANSLPFTVMLKEQGLCWNNFLDSMWSFSCPGCKVSKPKLRQVPCSCKWLSWNTACPVSQSPDASSGLCTYLLFLIHFLSLHCSLFFTQWNLRASHPILQFSGPLGTENACFVEYSSLYHPHGLL